MSTHAGKGGDDPAVGTGGDGDAGGGLTVFIKAGGQGDWQETDRQTFEKLVVSSLTEILLLTATIMNTSSLNIKRKSALHSFGGAFILIILFLLSLSPIKIPIAGYLIAGILTAEILRIIFSKRKYLVSIEQDDFTITIRYLNRMLLQKSISINKEGLNISDITETNWWSGNLDRVNFSNGKQNLAFEYVDRKLRQSIVEILGIE